MASIFDDFDPLRFFREEKESRREARALVMGAPQVEPAPSPPPPTVEEIVQAHQQSGEPVA